MIEGLRVILPLCSDWMTETQGTDGCSDHSGSQRYLQPSWHAMLIDFQAYISALYSLLSMEGTNPKQAVLRYGVNADIMLVSIGMGSLLML
jgi:hypothetical protein